MCEDDSDLSVHGITVNVGISYLSAVWGSCLLSSGGYTNSGVCASMMGNYPLSTLWHGHSSSHCGRKRLAMLAVRHFTCQAFLSGYFEIQHNSNASLLKPCPVPLPCCHDHGLPQFEMWTSHHSHFPKSIPAIFQLQLAYLWLMCWYCLVSLKQVSSYVSNWPSNH